MNLPIPASKVLPHRGKMLLIQTVLSANDGAGTAAARPSADSIARYDSGQILNPFYIELVAQAYAAVCGYTFLIKGRPIPEGYLVGVQRFEINQSLKQYSENELHIAVKTVGEFDGFAVVEGIVSYEDKVLAEGKIKIFVPQEDTPAELTDLFEKQGNQASCPL